MLYALALCAAIAAHTMGWPAVSAWFLDEGSAQLALAGALHSGIFLGLAGALLSITARPRLALPFLVLGCVAVLALLCEDIPGVLRAHTGWSKDLIDLGQRAGLLLLFFHRFEAIGRRVFV